MLQPRRTKFRKQFRPKTKEGPSRGGNYVAFGEFGLKAMASANITSRQIEAGRKAMTHFTKRGGRIWIRIFPDRPTTRKPPETRMGGGKGDLHEYVAPVQTGRIIFEMGGVSEVVAKEAMRLAANKLPIKCRMVERR